MDADPLREFDDGVAFWATRPKWPADLHNRFYADQQAITDGAFTSTWWNVTRRKLYDWRATRGARLADLDRLFLQHQSRLVTIWQTVIQPQLSGDVTSVTLGGSPRSTGSCEIDQTDTEQLRGVSIEAVALHRSTSVPGL